MTTDIGALQGLSGGVQAFDSFANAFADISKYNFEAQQFQMNQQLAELQSREALEQGREAQIASQQKTAELSGRQLVAQAESGVDVHTGTPAMVRQQTAERGGMDFLTIGNNAFLKSLGYKIQATNASAEAGMAKSAGLTEAGNQLLGGAEDLFQSKLKAIDYENFPTGMPG